MHYCIGDLHGRYDLLKKALDRINFDNNKDNLYLLGDLIDGGKQSLEIIEFAMKNKNVYVVRGNHEEYFISNIEFYDKIMYDIWDKNTMVSLFENYSRNLYRKINLFVYKQLKNGSSFEDIKEMDKVKEWKDNYPKRIKIFDLLSKAFDILERDIDKYTKLIKILDSLSYRYKIKNFMLQVFQCSLEKYEEIKAYIKSMPEQIELKVNDREVVLKHIGNFGIPFLFEHFVDLKTHDKTLVYGHYPIGALDADFRLQRIPRIEYNTYGLRFNPNEILSYIDRNDNCFYNLDLVEENYLGILRLEDFEEFYVMIVPQKARKEYKLITDSVTKRKNGYRILDDKEEWMSLVSYRNYCMEFFIYIDKIKKNVTYTRVDYYKRLFTNNFYDVFSIEDIDIDLNNIIKTVQDRFKSKKESEDVIKVEKYVRDIHI